jgi:hypothetical protein
MQKRILSRIKRAVFPNFQQIRVHASFFDPDGNQSFFIAMYGMFYENFGGTLLFSSALQSPPPSPS